MIRLILSASFVLAANSGLAPAQTPGADVPFQLVVRLAGGETVEQLTQSTGTQVVASYPARQLYVLQAPGTYSPTNMQSLRTQLQNDARVVSAEQNRYIGSPEGTTQSFFVSVVPSTYADQTAAEIVGLYQMSPAATGSGIRIAVLDTGVNPHPTFAARLLPGFNCVDSGAPTTDVGNGSDDNANGLVDELVGHGTMVAGVIALAAPQAQLLPVTVLNSDGLGTTFTVVAGIAYAVDAGADVINLSLATSRPSGLIDQAVQDATSRGVVVVAAAGNSDSPQPSYPAASPGVTAVAATGPSDHKAPFSNYGSSIDISAPGVDSISTLPDGSFGRASGTSFAAAWVSGVLAASGSLRAHAPRVSLDPILQNAVNLDLLDPTYVGQLGAGRLDAAAAFPPAPCRSADFNGDGDVGTDADIEGFFACLGGNCCAACGTADFNADGDSGTDLDIEAFFRVLGGGPC